MPATVSATAAADGEAAPDGLGEGEEAGGAAGDAAGDAAPGGGSRRGEDAPAHPAVSAAINRAAVARRGAGMPITVSAPGTGGPAVPALPR
ncbi:hypothetical protein Sru01_03430 [Sphaerisporangium rufum]|uniref:Uncharacterized protein n=1 Tax=Sphaerisporangium rufum TaxID=1381558 RepID=A0A919QZ10_9ACTN|nr:hypothetical protein Sru01_03430 [Sphaerisporangium rufum]